MEFLLYQRYLPRNKVKKENIFYDKRATECHKTLNKQRKRLLNFCVFSF